MWLLNGVHCEIVAAAADGAFASFCCSVVLPECQTPLVKEIREY